MKRRAFIKSTAIMVAAAGASNALKAAQRLQPEALSGQDQPEALSGQDQPESLRGQDLPDGVGEYTSPEVPEGEGKLITSAPMLQNYAETSMGVAFAVGSLANGYVLVGEKPDLSDARKVLCGGYRVTAISDKVIQVRLTGLKPATKYYYKVGADRIHYGGGYDMKVLGNEEDQTIHSFTTAGKDAEAHFCVINDTHARWKAIDPTFNKLAELSPSCVIWNGDATNVEETIDSQVRIFLDPEVQRKDYAADTPYLFCPGNHDSRGMANRHMENLWMFRQPEERDTRDWDLGRNFAVRMGKVALIGLDTAEDKMDTNPRFAGLFTSESYRKAQTVWLKDVLKRKDISSAPFLVAFCHIPLFDDNPESNPGDIAPDDTDPRYKHDFAIWQRTCANLWGPLLDKAGCQLVITAHQHQYRFDPPAEGRRWAQIVGGGPEFGEKNYPTVVEGEVKGGKLQVTVHNIRTGQVQETFSFAPRKRFRG